ncbi:hypothetical protein GCM10010372_05380 [Streptomyces tauricus]|uniref:hypothetical protein n=1 Tax=Streptomyces tauricus TaxID=68274 RepID=UPI0016749B2C|nr:hypothetical protein [Streptomyces tauricus]GHA08913.1 hypothetical protein GCM10010372_05380 [Streptomyces tauricus]
MLPSAPYTAYKLCRTLMLCLVLGLVLATASGCSEPSGSDPDQVIYTPDETTPEPEPDTSEPGTTLETTSPDPASDLDEEELQGSVPASVVGVWCGGANDRPNGHWTYAFTAEGAFAAKDQRDSFSGYVVTEGDVMTFYMEGADPVESTWAVAYEEALGVNLLYLDGYSYYPGSCES